MATIIDDDLRFCTCCTLAAANGDICDCEGHADKVTAGLDRLTATGAHIALNDGDDADHAEVEFTWSSCACCNDGKGGSRTRFALLST